MADAQYTFDSQRNSYYNGADLRVTETGTGNTIIVNEKDGMLAVNVKDDSTVHHFPPDVKVAFDQLGESKAQAIYAGLVEEWWRWADDLAQTYDFSGVFSAGRSSGWCAVDGTQHISGAELIDPTASDEDAAALTAERDKFLAFAFEAAQSIEDDWLPQFYEQLKAAAAEPLPRFRLYVSFDADPNLPDSDPRAWDDGLDQSELANRLTALAADAYGRTTVKIDRYELSRATVSAAAELAAADWHGPSEELMGGVPAAAVIKHVRETTDDEDELADALDILGKLEAAQ
jgi:hypothetical protein